MTAEVLILMGSDSDLPIMEEAATVLKEFGIGYRMHISSAHRAPRKTAALAAEAVTRGIKVIIAGAGMAAHLAGVVAAETPLPVIAVPLPGGALNGLDALYAMVQMPGGVPVATMAIGKAGAKNAGLFAVQILATADSQLLQRLLAYKEKLADDVAARDAALQQQC